MEKGCIENAPLPEYIVHVLNCCRVTRFNLFCSFLEIILWLHMILEVNIDHMSHCCKRPTMYVCY